MGRFLRRFSVVEFSTAGVLDFLKTLKRLNAKNHCSCINLIFTAKEMHFYGLISKLMVLLIKEEMHRGNVHASVALQQTILTHVHTKCPPVALYLFELFVVVGICIRVNAREV